MSWFLINSLLAQPELEVDTPTWGPIAFAAGAFLVVVSALVMMWKKLKQSEQWRRDDDEPHDNNNSH